MGPHLGRAGVVIGICMGLAACGGSGGSQREARSDATGKPTPPPLVTLTAASQVVPRNGATTLSWHAQHASACVATGTWSGSKSIQGSESTGPVSSAATFGLQCTGAGGTGVASVEVTIATEPPTLTLEASAASVDRGASARLVWSATGAASCIASGGWQGDRPASGSVQVGPITQPTSYSLECSNPLGHATALVRIEVNGRLRLSWVVPTRNVDGSTLTDLAGYRVYHGPATRSYSDVVEVADRAARQASIRVPAGTYYVAMTALNAAGEESAYSNEVILTAQ